MACVILYAIPIGLRVISQPIHLVMIGKIGVLYIIAIIKAEVWPVSDFVEKGHDIRVCPVYTVLSSSSDRQWSMQSPSYKTHRIWKGESGCYEPIREIRCHSIDCMMMSSNGNIFRFTGHLCAGPRWIPCLKANDAEFWCFLWYVPE